MDLQQCLLKEKSTTRHAIIFTIFTIIFIYTIWSKNLNVLEISKKLIKTKLSFNATPVSLLVG
jgi:hypothetical protein